MMQSNPEYMEPKDQLDHITQHIFTTFSVFVYNRRYGAFRFKIKKIAFTQPIEL
jgi:hypothetical protein